MMKQKTFNTPFLLYLGYLLAVHGVALLVFALFRLALFIATPYTFPPAVANDRGLQAIAFVKGLWFDNVVGCYILIPLLAVLLVASLWGRFPRWIYYASGAHFVCYYTLSFVIAAANIPYFAYFFRIINSSIYNWFGYAGTTTGMVFGEASYRLPILLALAVIAAFGAFVMWLTRRAVRCNSMPKGTTTVGRRILDGVAGLLCIGLCLFGIRGRMGYNPIKVSQAYYCTDPFLNQLGVNPVFNLLTSTLDDLRKENKRLHLMDDEQAVSKAQELLGREGMADISPLARQVQGDSARLGRPHVVLIFMESMSARLMDTFGSGKGLTPCLDSLYRHSLSFSHCYSAGIHTNHGMYATLYSFPALMKRNAMKGSAIPVYSGLPTVLHEHGWHNLFFMTHESQYDNMNAFYRTNGFDEVFAQEDYPAEAVVNSFGVPDDFLYQYALPILSERATHSEPFFTVLLSVSNHPPYVIPKDFKAHSQKPEEQIVEYADASIRHFLEEAKKTAWYENTVFILVGDHGKLVGDPESVLPESYNHIPLIIFGKGITPGVYNHFAGQVDIAPTLLGLLDLDYTQNNFGIDLLREVRPCAFYTADTQIAARTDDRLFIYVPESDQTFRYRIGASGALSEAPADSAFDSLRTYSFSMLQSAERLVEQGCTLDHPTKK
jgi:phosphoglycerol transferase MdoB-like AlkP superfamily enzyme